MLRDRVLFHLDPEKSTSAVFLLENNAGRVTGHTIVRVEREDSGKEIGLFSTWPLKIGEKDIWDREMLDLVRVYGGYCWLRASPNRRDSERENAPIGRGSKAGPTAPRQRSPP